MCILAKYATFDLLKVDIEILKHKAKPHMRSTFSPASKNGGKNVYMIQKKMLLSDCAKKQ